MPEFPPDPSSPALPLPSPSDRREFLASALLAAGATAALPTGTLAADPLSATDAVMPNPRLFCFIGGSQGPWKVLSNTTVVGDPLPAVARVNVVAGAVPDLPSTASWKLAGVTSNERYVTQAEKDLLVKNQAPLGRPTATLGALIPIRKSAAWWGLTQEERRAIFEETSRHIAIGLKYLPAIARRLHHCRDLATAEPFDFLTYFDYAPADAAAFDDLVAALRATPEWKYVDREVDLRLERAE